MPAGRERKAGEWDLVEVSDQHRPAEHLIEAGCVSVLGAPGEVVVVVLACRPAAVADEIVRVFLVAADRDRLTTGATAALGRELDEQREDVVPAPGLGVELVDDMDAHDRVLSVAISRRGCCGS
jgi:hypothetical protein